MSASCPHCQKEFFATRGFFGTDAITLRDAHVVSCEDNPKNKCFCGLVFPNSALRNKHAMKCEANPANRFKCPHCPLEFVNSFGLTGFFDSDGKALRDAHIPFCKENPANKCFCGVVFPNAAARNAHALQCEMNPANQFECQFCRTKFVTTYSVLGFRSCHGSALRDAHQVTCPQNPRNACFCGRVFPNPDAKEKHAATCEKNPANRSECLHCGRLFVTRYGIMGIVTSDGKTERVTHEARCEKNPANKCFCGQLFVSAALRDAHAAKCKMNPANNFACKHCGDKFITSFGTVMTRCGAAQRDGHEVVCGKNPCNTACDYCGQTFTEKKGIGKMFYRDVWRQRKEHLAVCEKNPANRFRCTRCSRCFSTRKRFAGLQTLEGLAALEKHHKECDVIPCSYGMVEAEAGEWMIFGEEAPAGLMEEDLSSSQEEDDEKMLCGPCTPLERRALSLADDDFEGSDGQSEDGALPEDEAGSEREVYAKQELDDDDEEEQEEEDEEDQCSFCDALSDADDGETGEPASLSDSRSDRKSSADDCESSSSEEEDFLVHDDVTSRGRALSDTAEDSAEEDSASPSRSFLTSKLPGDDVQKPKLADDGEDSVATDEAFEDSSEEEEEKVATPADKELRRASSLKTAGEGAATLEVLSEGLDEEVEGGWFGVEHPESKPGLRTSIREQPRRRHTPLALLCDVVTKDVGDGIDEDPALSCEETATPASDSAVLADSEFKDSMREAVSGSSRLGDSQKTTSSKSERHYEETDEEFDLDLFIDAL
eukprot:TRINITY_DN11649_c0_g1_i1.p1 TRINITY_DN11649_c0_g1~~TRINITY_DN11649_c0_g1_i1.p1  ORF type:complete len:770 (+),score=164.58 TRINITY_DN11649_c0_g1_i1:222-2531(+)